MVEKHKMQRIFATFGASKKMVIYKPKFEVNISSLIINNCSMNNFKHVIKGRLIHEL